MRSLLPVLAALFLFHCSSQPTENPGSRLPASALLDPSGYLYDPADRSCDGFPRLQVETLPGTCLGLVLPQSRATGRGKPWVMPRTLAPVPGTGDFLATDMGGWAENKGGLYWLRRGANGQYENVLLKSSLNMPHELQFGPGGWFYLGEKDHISRFRFGSGEVRDWQTVVSKLPRFKGYMHPLVSFAFDPRNNDLYVNSGAPSDHCFVKNHGSYSDCPEDQEAGLAAIFRIPGEFALNPPPGGVQKWEVAAKGLRNSMAMVVHPSGFLVQGENGQDFPQLEEPYEEMNVIDLAEGSRGRHYGWPYCYDFHAVSPDWRRLARPAKPVDCASPGGAGAGSYYQPPWILFPPHVAPLHMEYYPAQGTLAAELAGKLLVSWHGYQPSGHRLVAYAVNENGLPLATNSSAAAFTADVKNGCPVKKPYQPEGGLDRAAPYTEVISGWNEIKGVRPKGAPVGFTLAADGSIWILEDKNRVVLRLARSGHDAPAQCTQSPEETIDPRVELVAWRSYLATHPGTLAAYEGIRAGLLQKYCAECHGGFQASDIAIDRFSELDYLVKNELFVPKNALASKIYQALAQTGQIPPMPPGGSPQLPPSSKLVENVKGWITSLPSDIDRTYKKTRLKDSIPFHDKAGNASRECGRVVAGEPVYVDPRASALITKDGFQWMRVYVLPDDSRFQGSACAYPEDGVFYLPLRKQ